jgi:multiple sugar transport system ATP-binding protein
VSFVESLGTTTHTYLAYAGVDDALTCELGGHATVTAGDFLKIGLPANCCHLFDANGRAFKRLYRMPERRVA